MDPFETMMVALRFNERINQRDLEGLVELMTTDHTFIDSEDEVHEGRELMRARTRHVALAHLNLRNMGKYNHLNWYHSYGASSCKRARCSSSAPA